MELSLIQATIEASHLTSTLVSAKLLNVGIKLDLTCKSDQKLKSSAPQKLLMEVEELDQFQLTLISFSSLKELNDLSITYLSKIKFIS